MIGIIFACISLTAAINVAEAPSAVFAETVKRTIERGQCGFSVNREGQVSPTPVADFDLIDTFVDVDGLRWVVIEFVGPNDRRMYAPLPEEAILRGNSGREA